MARKTTSRIGPTDEMLRLQDILLLQQAAAVDLSSREERFKSRDRLQALFIALQGAINPSLTLEIGAHAAMFSRRMAQRGIEAHAFEANPHNHRVFAATLAEKAPAVRYHHAAVSDVDGEITFQVKESKDGKAVQKVAGNNSLLQREDPSFTYESVTVPSTRLETFLRAKDLAGREFSAWIDVEGALGKVTAGFGDALQSCLSLIVEVEEVSYWQGQMLYFDVMRYLGGQGMVPVARDFESAHQFNLVYLRPDVLQRPAVRLALAQYFAGR